MVAESSPYKLGWVHPPPYKKKSCVGWPPSAGGTPIVTITMDLLILGHPYGLSYSVQVHSSPKLSPPPLPLPLKSVFFFLKVKNIVCLAAG